MAVAFNNYAKPLVGKATVPAGHAKLLSWDKLEGALRRAGEVRPIESIEQFIVADDGVWLMLQRIR